MSELFMLPVVIDVISKPCDNDALTDSGAAAAPCQAASAKWVLLATILGSSMAFIDGTVVNVALPALQRELDASVANLQWVIEAYSLLLAALLLVGGSLGDRYGRRRVFLLGVALFAAASAWCGIVPDVRQLILARAVQGIGAALLVPGSLAIISSAFSAEERGRAIGTWSGFSAITAAIGPVLGGWLIEQFSWRAVFFINVPLAIVVVLLSLRHVPESVGSSRERLDWPGAAVIALGLGALVFALIHAPAAGFAHRSVLASLLVALTCFTAFVFIELRSANPMVPLPLFRSRNFAGANIITLFLYSALGAHMFFLPLNLIQAQQYSPTAAGAALLPVILIIFLLSRWSGGLVHRYGGRLPLIIGPIIAASGFILFALAGVGGSFWRAFFPALVVLGIGMAITVAPLTTVVMNAVEQTRVGIASGINNAVSRAAGLLAIAVLGIVMLARFNPALEERLESLHLANAVHDGIVAQRNRLGSIDVTGIAPELRLPVRAAIDAAFVDGFRRVMWANAVLALLAATTAAVLIEHKAPTKRRA